MLRMPLQQPIQFIIKFTTKQGLVIGCAKHDFKKKKKNA